METRKKFENDESLMKFWNEEIVPVEPKVNKEIIGNTFAVVKESWLRRLINYVIRK